MSALFLSWRNPNTPPENIFVYGRLNFSMCWRDAPALSLSSGQSAKSCPSSLVKIVSVFKMDPAIGKCTRRPSERVLFQLASDTDKRLCYPRANPTDWHMAVRYGTRCLHMNSIINGFKYTEQPSNATERLLRNLCRAWLLCASKSGVLTQAPILPLAAVGWNTELTTALQASASRETPGIINGGQFISERLRLVAEDSITRYPGDIVEIGCDTGESSRFLAELAQRHGRRLIAIDPWFATPERPEGASFARFQENIRSYANVVDVVRRSSLDADVKDMVSQRALAFAFVDGLHTYYAALSDIRMVSHCRGVIAVDDVSYGLQIMLALRHAARILGRAAVHAPPCKEGYLTPST
jgi:predicted O-methyltransferase YrrM